MLWLVNALGRVARLGCCARKASKFIRAATGRCGLAWKYSRLIAPLISYSRKSHYQHATTTDVHNTTRTCEERATSEWMENHVVILLLVPRTCYFPIYTLLAVAIVLDINC